MVNDGRIDSTRTLQDHHSAPTIPNNIDSLPLQSHRHSTWQQASHLDINLETFDDYRRRGIVPDPVDGTARWDIKLIDQWLDRASGIVSDMATPLDEWRTQRDG